MEFMEYQFYYPKIINHLFKKLLLIFPIKLGNLEQTLHINLNFILKIL